MSRHAIAQFAIVAAALLAACKPHGDNTADSTPARNDATVEELRAIAKEAYIYGFPLVDNYRIQYAYFVERGGPEFKAPWNEIFNNARVYTHEDTAVQTPNSDTPYSYIGADLRAEPLVLTIPPIAKDRYFSVQLVDAYTYNFAYLGSRTSGNQGGRFLLTGPNWSGEQPAGIDAVLRSETALAFAIYRTQLFGPKDIDNVKKIQAGYAVQPLSAYLGDRSPIAAPTLAFPRPLSPEQQRSSLEFFDILNFVLQFCPTHPSEAELMTRFARIHVGAGITFDEGALSEKDRSAIAAGMGHAWAAFEQHKASVDAGARSPVPGFGTREALRNNYLVRMSSAVLGIYGNSPEEAIYLRYERDSVGEPVTGSHQYALRFAPGQLPPVNAFWSLTMYELPSRLLTPNPLGRYLINSPMLPSLKSDADRGLTLRVQHESPGRPLEANWLPAPQGAFSLVLRLYWPTPAATDGTWTKPELVRLDSERKE